MQIACVAIIDANDELNFIESYVKSEDQYLFKFQAFTALQNINPQLTKRLTGQTPDPYIGFLYQIYLPEHEYDLYSYVTVSQLKFIIFVKQGKLADRRIQNYQPFFEKLYNLYRVTNLNPFGKIDYDKLIRPIVKEHNN